MLCWAVALPGIARGQVIEKEQLAEAIKGPLLDEEPFDLIFLDDYNRGAIMKVVPLKNEPPRPLPNQGFLIFEFYEESENLLQVPWERVVDFKTYRQLVTDEANAWLQEGQYDKAFRNFLYLYDEGGKDDPATVKALNTCLFQDGVEKFKSGEFELALSTFEDLYKKDPNFKVQGLNRTLLQINLACYEGIVRNYEQQGDYDQIRSLLTQVSKAYGPKADSLLARWRTEFENKSDELLEQARKYAEAGDGIKAHAAVRQANGIFPGRKITLSVYSDIVAKFPLVIVGVTQGPGDADASRIENWGARRVGKLTQRTLMEFAGLTDEGGHYHFVNGNISQIDDLGLTYRLEIVPPLSEFAVPPITAYQVSERLRSYADPDSPNYTESWAKVVDSVSVESNNVIIFALRVPFVRPEALLQLPYADGDESGQPLQNGPYVLTAADDDTRTYELNPIYDPVEDRQHPAIVERQFRTASEAVDALLKGDIDVLDRVPISDLPRLQKNPDIDVRPYIVPTVHMLIPNQRNEFVSDKYFRSGLLKVINKDVILNDMICNGREISGCETVSGPFPKGTVENDQLAYGYNLRVNVDPFNERLGMVLIEIVNAKLQAERREAGELNPIIERPPMILVHPDDQVARVACRTIARQWREVGVKTTLRELPDGQTVPDDDDWDFLYVAASIEEPLTDIEKILGEHGFAKTVSAPIEQSLQNLSYSKSWQESCSLLRQIHRQVANDVAILPLWQLTEFFAYRKNVREIGRDVVHLYENIERWRVYPIDEKIE